MSLLAMTLWPEWAAAVVLLDKRIENRSWHAPERIVGQRLAIHAGVSIGGRPGRPARAEALRALRSIPGVSEADAARCVRYADEWRGHVVATCVVRGSAANDDHSHTLSSTLRRWVARGQIGWLLGDVQPLDVPLPTRGRQGLWTWEVAHGH